MLRLFPALPALALLASVAGLAHAGQDVQAEPAMSGHAMHGDKGSVHQAWSRAMPPTATTGAVYFSLHNPGDADALIGAETPIAEKAELHTHVMENDLMKMRHVERLDVPAGGDLMFAPGGHHVMLFGLKKPLMAGDHFPLTLKFEHGGTLTTEVQVTDEAPAAGHEGMHEGMQH